MDFEGISVKHFHEDADYELVFSQSCILLNRTNGVRIDLPTSLSSNELVIRFTEDKAIGPQWKVDIESKSATITLNEWDTGFMTENKQPIHLKIPTKKIDMLIKVGSEGSDSSGVRRILVSIWKKIVNK